MTTPTPDPSTELPEAPAPLPPIPAEAAEAWKEVEARCKSEPLKRGMRYCLGGYSQREACKLAGLSDRVLVREGLKRWGLRDLANRTDRLVQNHREIAVQTTDALLERLADEDETRSIPAKELAVVGGISTDKVRDYERWTQGQGETPDFGEAVGRIAERIVKAGGRLSARLRSQAGEAEVSVSGAERSHEGPVVDVTPSGG
jgi:hypothetical protein